MPSENARCPECRTESPATAEGSDADSDPDPLGAFLGAG